MKISKLYIYNVYLRDAIFVSLLGMGRARKSIERQKMERDKVEKEKEKKKKKEEKLAIIRVWQHITAGGKQAREKVYTHDGIDKH